ncbi:MAG: TlpA family protein disulfide reductase [Clostridia bacterium]|nr:TlpA family protein disulfide reductase [Clostridia bacterium]
MMKNAILILLALTLFLAVSASAEDESSLLGKPFQDFTVTDIDGNTFTLSETLKDHEAVLINFWATWCGPCRSEFPAINKVYEEYKDKVAFIALSVEPRDTNEVISSFRADNGLTLPMGRDEDCKLYDTAQTNSIPVTVIVDRFGNAVFLQVGSFRTADDLRRTLDAFLGDQYTETAVLYSVPADTSTVALPVSPARALRIENEGAQKAAIHVEGMEDTLYFCTVNDSTAHVIAEISASDSASDVLFYNADAGFTALKDMLDPERGVLAADVSLPEEGHVLVSLMDYNKLINGKKDPDVIALYIARSPSELDHFVDTLKASGYGKITVEYETETDAGSKADAYIIHVLDQNGDPVPEVFVNFCTDTACVPCESDEDGTIVYTGTPDVYHVQIIDYPEGYSCDESFEMYTPETYGEWILRLRKD